MRTWLIILSALTLAACSGDGDKTGTEDTGTEDTSPTTGDDDDDPVEAILALTGDETAGTTVYTDNCTTCHGDSGEGGTGARLNVTIPAEEIVETVYYGEDIMPAYGETLTDQEIADVAAYAATFAP